MPYIIQSDRHYLADAIYHLCEDMREVTGEVTVGPGVANYVITKIVLGTMKPSGGWTYSTLSSALRVFRDAEAEMRRRLLDPYEDKAIERNGDIPEYEQ